MIEGLENICKADSAKSTKIDCTKTIEEYIHKDDWRIKANANTGYSNAGLINNISGKIIANYWLDKVYSKAEGDAHRNGDYYIHDLDCLAPYCCGHDLARLLAEGFNGVAGRVGSRPPKHLREALYQMANYIGILQAEWGGAQAFSSFDTYLAPYVFIDQTLNELSYDDIKKAIRNFVYNVNVPSRWGQCVPENYKCLKADGTWVTYTDLNIGDEIYVIDMNTGSLKCDKITHINVFDSPDEMHHYSNKQGFNFKVTPNHRVIYKTGSNPFKIKESNELLNISQISVPVAPWNKKEPIVNEIDKDYDISDDVLAFIIFIMTDGCIVKQEGKSPYISFCKSEKRWGGEFFEMLCNKLGFTYTKREKKSFGVAESVTVEYRLHVNDEILNIINMFNSQDKHKVPSFFKHLSSRQCKLVLDYWVRLDGNTDGGHWKMQADNNEIQEMLAYLAIRSGQSTSLNERIIGTNKNATKYTMVHKRGNRMCTPEIVKADTKKVWCPTTNTGTFVCMTNDGYVFLTGNCPFSNVTIDYTVPRDLANQYPKYEEGYLFEAVYNGYADKDSEDIKNFIKAVEDKLGTELCTEIKEDTNSIEEYHKELLQSLGYKHFEPEMRLIVKAFYETLNEGDEAGRPFTFPIPTVNITEDFNWDDENANLIFENAGKYGSSYFQNFIGSQYKRNPETGKLESDPNAYRPSDVRSMCPLTADTEILTLSQRGISTTQIAHLEHGNHKVYSDGKWYDFKKVEIAPQKVYEVKLSNGISVKMGEHHLQPIFGKTIECKDLKVGDLIPFNNKEITWDNATGSYLLGFAIGAYYGDGNADSDGTMQYSLDAKEKDDETEVKLRNFWESLGYRVKTTIKGSVRCVKISGNPFNVISRFCLGEDALTKGIHSMAFSLSLEARQGIIDGYIATDGDRTRKRISTSSMTMVNDLITLFTLQGKKALLSFTDDRDTRFGDNPNYIVAYPERDTYGEFYKTIDGQLYFTVKEINEIPQQKLYCIEVDNDSHTFVLANGMITHNCRLQLDKRELRKKGGGLFGADAQTGSIGVVTINMARLGYLCKGDKKLLIKKLTHLMELAKNTLEKKRVFVKEMLNRGLYPYTKRYLRTFDTFFSTIGVNGMNEMIRNFTNDEHDITDEYGQKFALEILTFIREKLKEYQELTDNLFNLEATPAEGCTRRLAALDTEKYPDIITAGKEGMQPYYTNSSQLPVGYTDDVFQALDLQDDLQTSYTGGTVLHLYMSEPITNVNTVKQLVKSVLTNYRLPYISVTPSYSSCPVHGYIPGHHKYCPKCDTELVEKYSNCECNK